MYVQDACDLLALELAVDVRSTAGPDLNVSNKTMWSALRRGDR